MSNYKVLLQGMYEGFIRFAVGCGIEEARAEKFVKEASEEYAKEALKCSVQKNERGLVETIDAFVDEYILREAVKIKIGEVVRKKPGGGGYVLWSPNKGKKKPPKKSGDFPTKLMAKQAMLDRFPPKDIGQLKRLRREIDRLRKDPAKRAEKERQWAAEPAPKKKAKVGPTKPVKAKAEGVERVYTELRDCIREALFREDSLPSQWDDYVAKLPPAIVAADKKLQNLHKSIQKQTEAVLVNAFAMIAKATKKSKANSKNNGVKKDKEKQRTFLTFTVSTKTTDVGPIYIFIEHGVPKIELSDAARQSLVKMEPEEAQALRGILSGAHDDFEGMTGVQDAIAVRDEYLQKMETQVDSFVSGLNQLQLSVLKKLLVQKYRGKK